MDSLNIAGKAVRLCIDNDESRVIEFYPTDVSFAENFYALAAEFEERQNDIKARSAAIAEGDGSKLEKSRAELALTWDGADRIWQPGQRGNGGPFLSRRDALYSESASGGA